MPTDSEQLRLVLELAGLGISQGHPSFKPKDKTPENLNEAIQAVTRMCERLEQAETRKYAMLDIANDVLSDFGYRYIGIRHKDDPSSAIETVLRLSTYHLSEDVRQYFLNVDWIDTVTVISDLDHDGAFYNQRYLINAPKSGADIPEDMPEDLIAILNVAIMRGVDLIAFEPGHEQFPDLPWFQPKPIGAAA